MRKFLAYTVFISVPLIVGYLYYAHYAGSGDLWSKQCSFHELTGLQCPGCGGQRAFFSLLHGDISGALQNNALLVFGLPFFLYIYFLLCQVYIARDKVFMKYFNFPAKVGYIFLAILVIFFILRNIPIWPFTYLSPP